MSDVTERGLSVFGSLMGPEKAAAMRVASEGDGFISNLSKLALDFVFGNIWARDGLDRKQRSLVTIGILIASHHPAELKNHIRVGLTNGLSGRELEEVLIQALPYVGFPAVADATTVLIEVLREKGLDGRDKTPEERGLL